MQFIQLFIMHSKFPINLHIMIDLKILHKQSQVFLHQIYLKNKKRNDNII